MKTPRRPWSFRSTVPWTAVVGMVVAVLFGILYWRLSKRREPEYQGRRLTDWLEHHVPSTAANPPFGSPGWHQAEEALRAIGTNAIPTLVEMIGSRDWPRPVVRVIGWVQGHGWWPFRYRYASARHEEAEYAFRVLGTNGAAAVPGLIRVYRQASSDSSRMNAALALGNIGSGARAAVAVLAEDFDHGDANVRFYAVSAVANIGGEPEVIVPLLTRALRDNDGRIRWNALSGLGRFGSRARPAVPEIRRLLEDPFAMGGDSIREQVETTLWRIAPERVGRPLVVEEAMPASDGSVVVRAFKAEFLGRRQVLVARGRPVPAVSQYWDSDPRSGLRLYRESDRDGGEDVFLGRYEVLGLPTREEKADLNVSTLCIVVDGRVYLAARDNHDKRFLEIRRVPEGGEPLPR